MEKSKIKEIIARRVVLARGCFCKGTLRVFDRFRIGRGEVIHSIRKAGENHSTIQRLDYEIMTRLT